MGLMNLLSEWRQARVENKVREHADKALATVLGVRATWAGSQGYRQELAEIFEGFSAPAGAGFRELLNHPTVATLANAGIRMASPLNTITHQERNNHFVAEIQDINERRALSNEWRSAWSGHPLQTCEAAALVDTYLQLPTPHQQEVFLDLVAAALHRADINRQMNKELMQRHGKPGPR